ncbi:hypothetical protein L798_14231 [Zootermopsis nevadensis]|uniref:Uncharacterized protein n=1 Tax=Zootermopsis nevadensis TaxID=136037 RepID=A0A067QSM6_ZOONE|nr:hypothetical protein L798_14231 [Zootermopsis nevadensis]
MVRRSLWPGVLIGEPEKTAVRVASTAVPHRVVKVAAAVHIYFK